MDIFSRGCKTEGLRIIRQLVLQIAQQHGAHHVSVFGPVARGEARQDSGIDSLVEMEPGRDAEREQFANTFLPNTVTLRHRVTTRTQKNQQGNAPGLP